MLQITPHIRLADDELQVTFIRASGPGGQNVNKVSTAVQLRFDAGASPALSAPVRERLLKLAGRRAGTNGVIQIEAQRFRTQARNRADAVTRLAALIERAARPPRPRRATAPSRAARERRLDVKRQHSERKRQRREPGGGD